MSPTSSALGRRRRLIVDELRPVGVQGGDSSTGSSTKTAERGEASEDEPDDDDDDRMRGRLVDERLDERDDEGEPVEWLRDEDWRVRGGEVE